MEGAGQGHGKLVKCGVEEGAMKRATGSLEWRQKTLEPFASVTTGLFLGL